MTVYTNTKFLPVISRMTFHSSSIPSHIWTLLYVTQLYSYHFLFGELLACHRGISFLQLLHSQHRVAAQPGTAGPHEINNTTTQDLHCVLSGTIFLSLARIDNWAPFVLLSAVRSRWSPRASDLVIWQWDVLWSLELASVALQKNSTLLWCY